MHSDDKLVWCYKIGALALALAAIALEVGILIGNPSTKQPISPTPSQPSASTSSSS